MAKKKTKRTKKKARRAPAKAGAGGGSRLSLRGVSVDALRKEIERRESKLDALEAQRDQLLGELETVEREISGITGSARAIRSARAGVIPPGRKRARNVMNLAEAMKKVLQGKTMSVTEIAEAVQRAGYKTTSAGNFRTIVNQTLIKEKKDFKRISRGQYTAK